MQPHRPHFPVLPSCTCAQQTVSRSSLVPSFFKFGGIALSRATLPLFFEHLRDQAEIEIQWTAQLFAILANPVFFLGALWTDHVPYLWEVAQL